MKRPMAVCGTTLFAVSAVFVKFGQGGAAAGLLAGALVFVFYLIFRKRLKNNYFIPAICLCTVLGSVACLVSFYSKTVPAMGFDTETVDVEGKVITVPSQSGDKLTFTLKTEKIDGTPKTMKIQVWLSEGEFADLDAFSYIRLENCKLEISRDENGREDFTSFSDGVYLICESSSGEILYSCPKTPYYYCLKLTELVNGRISEYFEGDAAGFLQGLIFGYTDEISESVLEAFRRTGITHILSVSGLHTSMWCAVLMAFLKLLRVKEKGAGAVCIIFLSLFAIMTAFTPPVLRSCFMTSLSVAAPVFKRRQDSVNSLGLAVSVLLIQNPYTVTSVSFLLSVFATLGVVKATEIFYKNQHKTSKIKILPLRLAVEWLALNVLISIMAGIFTLPLTACFFGTFSLIAPLTNILCVQVCFWGMICGTVGIVLSFISLPFMGTVTVFIFKITKIFLNLVLYIANTLTDFKLSSLPLDKNTFFVGFSVAVSLLAMGFFLGSRGRRYAKRVLSILCAVVLVFTVALPCIPLFNTEITVHNSKDGMCLTLRSGLKYAMFVFCENGGAQIDESKPLSSSESMDFLYLNSDADYYRFTGDFYPENTVASENAWYSQKDWDRLPEGTVIANEYSYTFSKEISFQIIDTNRDNCVIIRAYNKKILAFRGDYNGEIKDMAQDADIIICCDSLPDSDIAPETVVVFSGGGEIVATTEYSELKKACKNFFTTAESGAVTINIRGV